MKLGVSQVVSGKIVTGFWSWFVMAKDQPLNQQNKRAQILAIGKMLGSRQWRTQKISEGGAKHRRNQGGPKGPCPPKFLENIVILCFERRFSKQNSVIRLKLNILVYTAEYWQHTLPNTIYTFFLLLGFEGGHGTVPPPSVR